MRAVLVDHKGFSRTYEIVPFPDKLVLNDRGQDLEFIFSSGDEQLATYVQETK